MKSVKLEILRFGKVKLIIHQRRYMDLIKTGERIKIYIKWQVAKDNFLQKHYINNI